jgi:peptidoglycan/LPS O-acetylase OafA/YrhL
MLKAAYSRVVDKLARVTSGSRRILEIDGLRFVALAYVFVRHLSEHVRDHSGGKLHEDLFSGLIIHASIGVELFFLISGFILALPFASHYLLGDRPVDLKQYYWRRVTRLEPPYLLMLGICYLVLVFYWHQPARAMLPHLLASMVYLHNIIYRASGYMSTINIVAWSLEIEVQFYLVAPLIALLFKVNRPWLRRVLIFGSAVMASQSQKLLRAHGLMGDTAPQTLYGYYVYFAMGFLLADIYLVDWKRHAPPSRWADLIAIPGFLLLPWYFHEPRFHGHKFLPDSGPPYILFMLVYASFRGVWTRRLLSSSFLVTVGGMCYSIYLIHQPILDLIAPHAVIPLPGVPSLALNTIFYTGVWGILILFVSAGYFLLIEKPCMRRDWPQRLAAWLKGRPVTSSPAPAGTSAAENLVSIYPAAGVAPLAENPPVP